MGRVSQYASLVKFSHTIFALPFALVSLCYAYTSTDTPFEWVVVVQVLLAMLFARNAAMGFNRLLDRHIDARNPRTQNREIPAGVISARSAGWFVAGNTAGFIATAAWINPLALMLSPVALLFLLGYSYTKRFTALCHLVLGIALGIAPVGAYIAVTGSWAVLPVLLSTLVVTWVGGFDVIYALQDVAFDRSEKLHSIPTRLGVKGGLLVSALLHLCTLLSVWAVGRYLGAGVYYWVGSGLFTTLLIYQHVIVTPRHLERAGARFGLINGITGLLYALFFIVELLA